MKNPFKIYYAYFGNELASDFISYYKRIARLRFDLLEVKLGECQSRSAKN